MLNQETQKNIKFPRWLEEIFYQFTLTYGPVWVDRMPTDASDLPRDFQTNLI